MSTALSISKTVSVTPFIDIQASDFAKHYRNGVWWSLYGDCEGEKPLPETYLIDNLKRDTSKGYFDGYHNDWLPYLGFYFGMIHGGVLSPETGNLRTDITSLVTFQHQHTLQGYTVARRDRLYYLSSESCIATDTELLEDLRDIAYDAMKYPHEADPWYYSIGCVLGHLSILIFPATPQEWKQWEAEHRRWQENQDMVSVKPRSVEPLDALPLLKYTA